MSTSIRASYARLAMTARATKDLRWYLCGIRVEPARKVGRTSWQQTAIG